MVCDGVPRWETAVINRAHAANRTCGLPITGDSRIVDHVERIDRRALSRDRFLTRFAAASLALGMVGALYTSVRLDEDWLRAALYLIIFVGLTFTSAGKFSIDRMLKKSS